MGDQSFRALILSLALHAIFAWSYFRLPSQNETEFLDQPIEVEIADVPDAKNKGKYFVTETEKPDISPLDKLREEADHMSLLTKRVKEQMVAKLHGQTKNRTGTAPIAADEMRAKGQRGDSADPERGRELVLPENPDGEFRQKSQRGSTSFGREIVVGQSTLAEDIPGVKSANYTALNTDASLFYTFYKRVEDGFRPRWTSKLRNFAQSLTREQVQEILYRARPTEVDIQLDREGNFLKAVIYRSSGYHQLDDAFTIAFKEAESFPNPPLEMIEDDGLIHLRFRASIH